MTADEAIREHRECKNRFNAAIGTRQPINVAEMSADDCCQLGRWLHGDGRRRFGLSPVYQRCVETHAAFHLEAGKIAACINAGEVQEAARLMASDTPYTRNSEALAVSVIALFRSDAGA